MAGHSNSQQPPRPAGARAALRSKSIALALALSVSMACLFAAPSRARAQGSPGDDPAPKDAAFSYKFENPRFVIPLMEVDLDAEGRGQVRFKRGESDEVIDFNLKLMPSTLARIRQLLESAQFFTSAEEYQSKKDFSYLGWMTITARAGERQRTVRFNHTLSLEMKELAELFRAIATQGMHLFNIESSQQYQPLDLPGQLDALENDLRLQRIAEPEQMLPVLREIAGNDTAPLIARNHATRIISAIEKKKYKSPFVK